MESNSGVVRRRRVERGIYTTSDVPRAARRLEGETQVAVEATCGWVWRSSDGKDRLGRISKQGSPALSWALVEAAQKCTTGGGSFRESYERIAKRRGARVTRVAIPRRILTPSYTACATESSLPGAPQPGDRERRAGGVTVAHAPTTRTACAPATARSECSGELAVCHGLANHRAQPSIDPLWLTIHTDRTAPRPGLCTPRHPHLQTPTRTMPVQRSNDPIQ